MNLIALIVLVVAALAVFLDWYVTTPRRFGSHVLGLCLFIIGVILVFVLAGNDPNVHVH